MRVPVYNLKGETVGDIELPEKIFGKKWNADLVHQAVTVLQTRRRKPSAHAKGRGEVSGGGIKPWRQKGTGRARHGSIRSPIWKGGGVSHGPTKERRFNDVRMPAQMKKAAMHAALSHKLAEEQLRIIDAFSIEQPKTKALAGALAQFFKTSPKAKNLSVLLVPAAPKSPVYRAASNIPSVRASGAGSLGVEDVMRYKHLLIEREVVGQIK